MPLKYYMPFLHSVAKCVIALAASHHQEASEMQNLGFHSVPGNQHLHANANAQELHLQREACELLLS